MKAFRHGDIAYRKVAEVKGEKVFEGKEFILAEGEATGHHHRIKGPKIRLYNDNGTRYLDAPRGGVLTHPEHKEITVEPGIYIEIREREFDYFQNDIRRVVD